MLFSARRSSPIFYRLSRSTLLFLYFFFHARPQSAQADRGAGARSQRLSDPGCPEDPRQADTQPRDETAHVHETDNPSAAQVNATASARTQETGLRGIRRSTRSRIILIIIMIYYLSMRILNSKDF